MKTIAFFCVALVIIDVRLVEFRLCLFWYEFLDVVKGFKVLSKHLRKMIYKEKMTISRKMNSLN